LLNSRDVYHAQYKEQDQSKKRRKVLTGKKKEGKTQQPEGSTYTAGQF